MEAAATIPNDDRAWRVRVDLALCYRMVAHHGLTDLIYTHISARVPGTPDRFLLNRLGVAFDEMTASDLIEVGTDGPPAESDAAPINLAGYTIHSAIHMARPDVACALHLHSRASMAVAALERGLLPLNQISMQFHDRLAYHDYEGIAFDLDERQRLIASIGDKNAMILRNHGLLALGDSIAKAFTRAYYLEKACQIQLDAMATGAELRLPPPEVCEHAARQFDGFYEGDATRLDWEANRRAIDRVNPGYDA
jgi:ribulose-5-phosphate 4-epimerase/fuculose-1-phosphate aldolase